MAIELHSLERFTFPSRRGEPQNQSRTVEFARDVRLLKAVALINGFSIGFTNTDHNLLREEIDVSTTLTTGNDGVPAVLVRVKFALRDSSGQFDDPFDGYVDVVLIVDRG